MKNIIFETLREDHKIQRDLAKKMIATEGKSDERDLIFKKLKHELEIHADAEERFFYKPLISADLTQDKSRHGIAEHHEMDELVEKLNETEMSSPQWLPIAKELAHKINHHLDEEEHEIFQLAGKVLDQSKQEELGKEYLAYVDEHRIA